MDKIYSLNTLKPKYIDQMMTKVNGSPTKNPNSVDTFNSFISQFFYQKVFNLETLGVRLNDMSITFRDGRYSLRQ